MRLGEKEEGKGMAREGESAGAVYWDGLHALVLLSFITHISNYNARLLLHEDTKTPTIRTPLKQPSYSTDQQPS